jgi:hypothetical protein
MSSKYTIVTMGLAAFCSLVAACDSPSSADGCDGDELGCEDALEEDTVSPDVLFVLDPLDRDEDGDGVTPREGDCDDAARGSFPGARDRPGDGVDQDCDGVDLHLCGDGVGYQSARLASWEVCVSHSLLDEEPELASDVLERLLADLEVVSGLMPKAVVMRLRQVRIWVEREAFGDTAAVYHPSAAWLEENGYPTDWAEGIQIANAKNYLSWRVQPAMVLHELAHAWHHQVIGFDAEGVLAAFDNAVSSGLYDDVSYPDGTQGVAYALTDHKEYFAELTEALFWKNDMYPFTKQECLEYDPFGAAAVLSAWDESHLQ